jgi:hypothetical protein
MQISFNGLERHGNLLRNLLTCRLQGHRWFHDSAEYHHDSSETHYFTCTVCGRVEHDITDAWKYLRGAPNRQREYIEKHNKPRRG